MWVRIIAATVAGGIVMFFLGFLFYGVLLFDFMKSHTVEYAGLMKEPMPDMVPLVLSNISWAFLLAFVLDYWARIRTFVSGLKAGAIIMFALALGLDLQMMGVMNLFRDASPLIVDVVVATVIGALTGGVIGLVLGLMDRQMPKE
jgi:hypothetical protein